MNQRANLLIAFLSVFFTQCTAAYGASKDQDTIVVRWNKTVLEAVRRAHMGPPMVARALAIFHTCIYDAWAAYDDYAVATHSGTQTRRPKSDRTQVNKAKAMSFAAYRAAVDLFPRDKRAIFDPFMIVDLGYNVDDVTAKDESPEDVGSTACRVVLESRHRDGSNQLGDMPLSRGPYADYTGYIPQNPSSRVPIDPGTIRNLNRYQPLYYDEEVTRLTFQEPFMAAQWYKVVPFSGPYENELLRMESQFPVALYGSELFNLQAQELVEISAALSDEQKMISEYWTDGPNSELPAGHWCLFAQFVSKRDHHSLDQDAKFFFVLTNAVFDAGVAAWTAKRKFDSVRPVSAIPYLFRNKKIQCWAGPRRGTSTMDGVEWRPYQPKDFPTPPFPEYPSGHSAFSSAAATILELWTHSSVFGYAVTLGPGSSKIEPGITPKAQVTLYWPTFRSAADQAGMSRRFGGLHFRSGDLAGRLLGRLVAEKVWSESVRCFAGSQHDHSCGTLTLPL